jgi:hypothetical protein
MDVSVNATFARPGGPLVSGRESDSLLGGSDFYGLGTLKRNSGVNNYMVYAMAGAPVGAYDTIRLANLGR